MRGKRRLISILVVLLVLAVPAVALAESQNIHDYWRLRQYKAPAEISTLADQTTMNAYGRKLFYVMHPELDDKDSFNQHCKTNEQTIVLGCHVSGQAIYLLKVSDSRLNGVEQVTAAHEMLHEAYERLSINEQKHIDQLVTDTYAHLNNSRLTQTVELYRKKDPSVVPNELHSILGTEIRNLPPELETYYKRYFSDRSAIVTLSEQYEDVFTERRNAVNQYDAQLTSLKNQIDILQAQLSSQQTDLNTQRSVLDQLLHSSNKADYNAKVPVFNEAVRAYNANIDKLQSLVTQYNQIVVKRNNIADEEQTLVQEIDSNVQPQHTQ